jgi:hypothetical protein
VAPANPSGGASVSRQPTNNSSTTPESLRSQFLHHISILSPKKIEKYFCFTFSKAVSASAFIGNTNSANLSFAASTNPPPPVPQNPYSDFIQDKNVDFGSGSVRIVLFALKHYLNVFSDIFFSIGNLGIFGTILKKNLRE